MLGASRSFYERALMLDSGPLISLYAQINELDANILATLSMLESERIPIFYNRLVIAEVHRRLLFDRGILVATSFLERFPRDGYREVELQQADHVEAVSILQRYHDQTISYTDAITMAQMRRLGIYNVFTHDFHFGVVGFGSVDVRENRLPGL
ncbi:MAG: type II toxin-antitoxin system VapC family toxin [Anaerolineales bacterium]|nr:type II toxin-antitoxin system VapC family toxin [Anaerolineales bacterium]